MSKQSVIQNLIDAENRLQLKSSALFPHVVVQRAVLMIVRLVRSFVLLSDCITEYPRTSFLSYARQDEDGRILDSYTLHLGALRRASLLIVITLLLFGISALVVLASVSF